MIFSENILKIDKDELRYFLDNLRSIRGRHTELVSIYVPAGHNINEIKDMVSKEISTAQNIKSKTTRNNVIGALSKIANSLKYINVTPPNGLVIFSGNVAEREGEQNIKIWLIEPPEPVNVKLYRCDQTFVTNILEETLESKEVYGIIALDRQEAGIGFLRGKRIEVVKRIESLVPGKTAKGGQSAARFMRVREGLLNAYLKEVGETAKSIFEHEDLQGILIGGPGPLKQEFYEGNYLPENLKRKVLGLVDTGYAGEVGVREVIERGEDLIKESEYLREKRIVNEFFTMLHKNESLVRYGLLDVMEALEQGAVEKLLVSQGMKWVGLKVRCNSCGASFSRISDEERGLSLKCPYCGSTDVSYEHDHYIRVIKDEAKNFGTEVYIISDDSPEGKQFKMFSGIGAILRYKL